MSEDRLSQLFQDLENTPDYQFESTVVDLTEEICKIMDEREISRADLARKLGKSRAYVTKLLRGDRNLTLRTIVDVLWELGQKAEIRTVPLNNEDVWDEKFIYEFSNIDVKVYQMSQTDMQAEDYEPKEPHASEGKNAVAA